MLLKSVLLWCFYLWRYKEGNMSVKKKNNMWRNKEGIYAARKWRYKVGRLYKFSEAETARHHQDGWKTIGKSYALHGH